MNWDDMTPSENGRFCGKCSKEVFNLTDCSLDEVRALQRKHGGICGMVKTTVVAASLTLAACEKETISVGLIVCPPPEQDQAEVENVQEGQNPTSDSSSDEQP